MKRNNNQLTLFASALLLFAATLGMAGCSQSDNEPEGVLPPAGEILLTPGLELRTWGTDGTPGTRADQFVPVSLTPGGEIMIGLFAMGPDGKPDVNTLQMNRFEVNDAGRLTRLPYKGTEEGETEAPLSIKTPGTYVVAARGTVNLLSDGLPCRAIIGVAAETSIEIGDDGKISVPCIISSGGLRLNLKAADGTAYSGADVTALPKSVFVESDIIGSKDFETKTLNAGAPSALWGELNGTQHIAAGSQILELVTGGKTYKVNTPRDLHFTSASSNVARLFTFNVRIGVTNIIVSSADLGIDDFEVQPEKNYEMENMPLYNGELPNLLALPGKTAYWVAPEDLQGFFSWSPDITGCPDGWHIPTVDELVAMTGYSIDGTESTDNFGPIANAFLGSLFLSLSEKDTDNYYGLYMTDTSGQIVVKEKYGNVGYVRCVKLKE